MTRVSEPSHLHVAPDRHQRIAGSLLADGWSVEPAFFEPALVAELRNEALEAWRCGLFRPAGVGRGARRQLRSDLRGDRILWLEPPLLPAQQRYLAEMERLRLALNGRLHLGLFGFEAHLARFPAGARYARHLDVFNGDRRARRVLSCTLYLNHDWHEEDGGELRLWAGPEPEAGHRDIAPRQGTLVSFLSEQVPHEVLSSARERLSVTGWFRARP